MMHVVVSFTNEFDASYPILDDFFDKSLSCMLAVWPLPAFSLSGPAVPSCLGRHCSEATFFSSVAADLAPRLGPDSERSG